MVFWWVDYWAVTSDAPRAALLEGGMVVAKVDHLVAAMAVTRVAYLV